MSDLYVLKEYFIRYLKIIKKKDSTVNHYIGALDYITRFLIQREKIHQSIYEITDIGELQIIRTYLKNDVDFLALDRRGHQMYSAGLNNYLRFATGEGFGNMHDEIQNLDIELPVKEIARTEISSRKRSNIIKTQAIESAGYLCEMDICHRTFTAKSTGNQYMEGHHAIPMKVQESFKTSLDVYANIVCLCPICHRMLHYGIDDEKKVLINQIYYKRADRLANSGIKLTLESFEILAV
ncbi:HNH endonuclease [Anaerosporobacter sp.]|uniref:HNH endonuclease n=1 Tax=Anaerosporobacter sp. TaxID=1872529 RepID=UPI00286F7BA3|nr:HNH endonuclease [Anaerosporobacter sp.]